MSETNIGASIPQQASPGQAPTGQVTPTPTPPVSREPAGTPPEPTGWVGWIFFAATVMLVLGVFHAIAGLVAIFKHTYYLVGDTGLTVQVSYTAWGWTHLVLGVLVAVAGVALFTGQMWARVVGVVFASISAILNIAFLAAYPVWCTIMIAVAVLVIWALTVHGAEMKNVRGDQTA